jgi:hypothetical protein
MQGLTESGTEREETLWAAVLDFVAQNGSVTREQVLRRFKNDPEREVIGVLTDLVANGVIPRDVRKSRARNFCVVAASVFHE